MHIRSDIDPLTEVQTMGDAVGGPVGDYVQVVTYVPVTDAERLAAHLISRDGAAPLAAEAREIATPVMEALVAAGYGVG